MNNTTDLKVAKKYQWGIKAIEFTEFNGYRIELINGSAYVADNKSHATDFIRTLTKPTLEVGDNVILTNKALRQKIVKVNGIKNDMIIIDFGNCKVREYTFLDVEKIESMKDAKASVKAWNENINNEYYANLSNY